MTKLGEWNIATTHIGTADAKEVLARSAFGDHEQCAECPKSVECMAGSLGEQFFVASTVQEHRTSITLFCVEEGLVKLIPYVVGLSFTNDEATGFYHAPTTTDMVQYVFNGKNVFKKEDE